MFELTELQHDALVEIFNMGVGSAANAMSRIVNEEVAMSVPRITFQNRADAAMALGDRESRRISGVSQRYEGSLSTDAVLMFPEEKSLEIVRLMVGDAVPMEELTEMEQEAMSEIGNIILNACVGTLANIFNTELQGSLPNYMVGSSSDILSIGDKSTDDIVLMLHIDFAIEKHRIDGYVAFLLDMMSMHDLRQHIDNYLAGI
ncbi:MAG: chemotaxis protein CheC [Burkholderiaceae bacterium]|nr:chemotaxis protein CheC [Burkholderiaceae bacterium]